MTTRELARLGREMRAAQNSYFHSKGQDLAALERAKGLERLFDQAVRAVLSAQPSLFGAGDGEGREL